MSWLRRTALPLLAAALFTAAASSQLTARSTETLFAHWRAFDDLALAIGHAGRGEFPVASYRVRNMVRRERDPRFVAFRSALFETITNAKLSPGRPWEIVPGSTLTLPGGVRLGRRLDDVGRPLMVSQAFRVLGGVSPFLVFWIGVFAMAGTLAWAVFELSETGRGSTGLALAGLCSASAFLLDVALLGYSPAAFHLAGLFVVLALAVFAQNGRPSVRALLVRATAAGLVLGLCALGRATVLTFAAAVGLALLVSLRRTLGEKWRTRRAGWLAIALVALVALPSVALFGAARRLNDETVARYGKERLAAYHDAVLIWKGLGDFDREKGYEFWDMAGQAAVRKVSPNGTFDREGERNLWRSILADIRSDPAWFAGILGQRLLATVAFPKLWSRQSVDQAPFFKATSKNEGVIDAYYSLCRQVDRFALGRREVELPTWMLLLPACVWLAWWSLARGAGRSAAASRLRSAAFPVLCLSLAVLPTPILISTATAIEPQSFLLVHLFLAASCAGAALGLAAAFRRTAPSIEA